MQKMGRTLTTVVRVLLLARSLALVRVSTLNDVQIRDNALGLAPLVKAFARRGARSANTYVLEPKIDAPTARRETASLLKKKGDDGQLFVARDGEDLLGMALLRAGDPQMLDMIAVGDRARDRGVGKKLLKEVAKSAAQRGSTLELEVEKFNEAGKRFFERQGFVQTGMRQELRVMTKQLANPLAAPALAAALAAALAGGAALLDPELVPLGLRLGA